MSFPLAEKPGPLAVFWPKASRSVLSLLGFPSSQVWSRVSHQHCWHCLSCPSVCLWAFLSVSSDSLITPRSFVLWFPWWPKPCPPCPLIPASEGCLACSELLLHFILDFLVLAIKSFSTDWALRSSVSHSTKLLGNSARIRHLVSKSSPYLFFLLWPGFPVTESRRQPVALGHVGLLCFLEGFR